MTAVVRMYLSPSFHLDNYIRVILQYAYVSL